MVYLFIGCPRDVLAKIRFQRIVTRVRRAMRVSVRGRDQSGQLGKSERSGSGGGRTWVVDPKLSDVDRSTISCMAHLIHCFRSILASSLAKSDVEGSNSITSLKRGTIGETVLKGALSYVVSIQAISPASSAFLPPRHG